MTIKINFWAVAALVLLLLTLIFAVWIDNQNVSLVLVGVSAAVVSAIFSTRVD